MRRSLSPPPSPHPAPLPLSSSHSMTRCPELDLSITLSPTPKAQYTHLKPRAPKTSQHSDQSQLRPFPVPGRQANTQVCFKEQLVDTATLQPHSTLNRDAQPQQPIRGQRRSGGCHHGSRQRVEPPAAASNQEPGCLERAEPNTTLALKAELQTLQGAEFNSQKAVQETLRTSERTKNLINTRATEVVNVSRSELLFTSLVSVEVREDQLINQVLQDRLQLLAPPLRCHGNKAADSPSLLPFRPLLRQTPLPPEEDESLNYKLRPQPRPAYSTFDLYRRRTRCEATP